MDGGHGSCQLPLYVGPGASEMERVEEGAHELLRAKGSLRLVLSMTSTKDDRKGQKD